MGLRVIGPRARIAEEALKRRLVDESMDVRIAAADALCRFGDSGVPVLVECLRHENYWVKLHAAVILNENGDKALPALPVMKELISFPDPTRNVGEAYLGYVLERTIGNLE